MGGSCCGRAANEGREGEGHEALQHLCDDDNSIQHKRLVVPLSGTRDVIAPQGQSHHNMKDTARVATGWRAVQALGGHRHICRCSGPHATTCTSTSLAYNDGVGWRASNRLASGGKWTLSTQPPIHLHPHPHTCMDFFGPPCPPLPSLPPPPLSPCCCVPACGAAIATAGWLGPAVAGVAAGSGVLLGPGVLLGAGAGSGSGGMLLARE